jgi:hypothetical protein
MLSSELDITALRQGHDRLSRRIGWIAFVRLLALLSLVVGLYIGFARALERVAIADLEATRNEIESLATSLGKGATLFFKSEDPIGFREGKYNQDGAPLWSGSGIHRPAPLTDKEKEGIASTIGVKRKQLGEIYDRAFVSQHEFVVDRVDFDVRHWPLVIPPLLILLTLSQVYVHILRKKRQLLTVVGTHLTSIGGPEVPMYERLSFSPLAKTGDSFRKHPAVFLKWLNVLAWVGLLICLFPLFALSSSWADDVGPLAGAAGAVALYAVVYGRYVSGRLERQVESILGTQFPPTWVARCWTTGTRSAQWLTARLKPKWSLGTGSLLLLMSLLLVTSTNGCGNYRGYEIVLGRGAWWSVAVLDQDWFTPILNPVTRGVYVLGLALAVLSVVLVLVRAHLPEALRSRRCLTVLSVLSCAVSLFALGDATAVPLYQLAPTTAPWTFGWLVPWGVWLRVAFWRKDAARGRWLRIRPAFVALLLPVVVLDVVTLFFAVDAGVYGLLAFYFGAHFLALGYLKLATEVWEADPAAHASVRTPATLREVKGIS